MWYYSPMTELHDFITIRPEELTDALADGPRGGHFNPDPEELQALLAEVHAELGDRDPAWSSEEGLDRGDAQALQVHLDGDIPF